MKKRLFIIFGILIVIICSISVFVIFNKKNNEKTHKNNNQERYVEIRKNVNKAVEKELSVVYPFCSVSQYDDEIKTNRISHYNSSYLINLGYIKKKELLDVDNKSYCDSYVEISENEDSSDYQQNCKIYYKIYLKCKDYEDKGYKETK